MNSDDSVWGAIAIVLTALGATWTYIAWQRRGLTAALRGAAWTLLPIAAWLTGTLRLAADISGDVSRWAGRLVFSPSVWLGVIVAGVSVVLFGTTNQLKRRGIGTNGSADDTATDKPGRKTKAPRSVGSKKPAADDGMEDINDILKRHGIS